MDEMAPEAEDMTDEAPLAAEDMADEAPEAAEPVADAAAPPMAPRADESVIVVTALPDDATTPAPLGRAVYSVPETVMSEPPAVRVWDP